MDESLSGARLNYKSTFDILSRTCATGRMQKAFPISKAWYAIRDRDALVIVAWRARMTAYVCDLKS